MTTPPAEVIAREEGRGDRTRAPDPREAALLLALVIALNLAIGYPVQAYSLIPGVLVTEWLLIALPVLIFVRVRRLSPRAALLVRAPTIRAATGAAISGATAWYLVGLLVEHVQSRFLPIPPEIQDALRRLVSGSERPLMLDLFALAISPAICEEMLFRGILLRATEHAWSPRWGMMGNAVLFAAFHLSVYRFVPTAVLGLILAAITYRTRSIFPAIVFHLLNNAATLLAARYLVAAEVGLPIEPWLAAACTLACAAGLMLALRSAPTRSALGDPRGR